MARRTEPALDRAAVGMLEEVRAGLAATQKKLPPKFFYDRRGSELFEAITRLPEYYLTRAERAILERWMPALVAALRPRAVVELGAGSAEKTETILDALVATPAPAPGGVYVPIDVSADFLRETAHRLHRRYPGLRVAPEIADLAHELRLPRGLPRPALLVFLGSTIGNFHQREAIRLLRRAHAAMRPEDRFLLGVDLRKDPARLVAAYNDAAGVTAEFNRNVLRVLNHQLGADFVPDRFGHRAFYNRTAHRIEMHLVSTAEQAVTIPGIGVVAFAEGETIRTEISCKYDRAAIEDLFYDAGLRMEEWRTDPEGLFAMALGAPL